MKEKTTAKKTGSKKSTTSGKKFGKVMKVIWNWLCLLKGFLISLPVLGVAIWQAFDSASKLPESVGINLLATGEYAMMIPRSTAVLVPLLVTIGCVLLTCFSKRVLFPWLISVFTLVLPVLIWVTNIYPA